MSADANQIFTQYIHDKLLEYENDLCAYYGNILKEKDEKILALETENTLLRDKINQLIEKRRIMAGAYSVNPVYEDILNNKQS